MSDFDPSPQTLRDTADLFTTLIKQGRKIVYEESLTVKRIREMQEEASARNLAAAQRALDRMQWRPRASIALVHVYTCQGCGTQSRVLAGFGVSMHRRSDSAERILMCSSPDEGYAKEVHETHSTVSVCSACLASQGFNYAKENHLGGPGEPVPAARDCGQAQACGCRHNLWGSKVRRTDSDS